MPGLKLEVGKKYKDKLGNEWLIIMSKKPLTFIGIIENTIKRGEYNIRGISLNNIQTDIYDLIEEIKE